MTSKRKSTFDQIAELLNPAPEIGSDDDLDFVTRAKVVEDYEDEFDEEDKQRRPTFKQSAALDDDPRYIGERVSRRKLGIAEDSGNESSVASDSDPASAEENSESEKDLKSSGVEAESGAEDNLDENYEEYNSDDQESSADYESGSGSSKSEDEDSKIEIEDGEEHSFQHISSTKSVETEVEKGNAVKNQLHLWDNLLECRIHLQKCLIPANRLPKYEKIDNFIKEGGDEFSSELKKTKRSVGTLLDKLIALQKTLIDNYSETKNLGQKKRKENNLSDEEIPSDTDQEDNSENVEKTKVKSPKVKRRRVEEYEQVLDTNHKQYIEFRDSTIGKWNDRTKLFSGKVKNSDFSAFEQSTLQQIRYILSNRTRLIQRTRMPRSVGTILGEPEPTEETTQSSHDPEIFDDSDFYHQLLRELIERRTDESEDAAAIGRRWAALQKFRTKMKRRVDTRATKGRRLRYDPHQKLVGFMAPMESSNAWSDKAVTELFNSLFGKKL